MNTPGPEHFIFIPGVLLIGIVIGYIMGARAARAEMDAQAATRQGVKTDMIDFELTEEQRALIETARRFAASASSPSPPSATASRGSRATSSRRRTTIGLVNPTLPTEYGGAGLSDVDSTLHHRGARVRLHRHPDEHHREHARR